MEPMSTCRFIAVQLIIVNCIPLDIHESDLLRRDSINWITIQNEGMETRISASAELSQKSV